MWGGDEGPVHGISKNPTKEPDTKQTQIQSNLQSLIPYACVTFDFTAWPNATQTPFSSNQQTVG